MVALKAGQSRGAISAGQSAFADLSGGAVQTGQAGVASLALGPGQTGQTALAGPSGQTGEPAITCRKCTGKMRLSSNGVYASLRLTLTLLAREAVQARKPVLAHESG